MNAEATNFNDDSFDINNIGLTELMDARVSYLQSTPEFIATPPSINNISVSLFICSKLL